VGDGVTRMKISATIAPAAPLKAPTLLRGDLFDCISRAADFGYQGIELQLNLGENHGIDFEKIAEFCDSKNMEVCAYATGSLYTKNGLSLAGDDPSVIREAIDRLKLYMEAAKTTGGKVVIGCLRGNVKAPEDLARTEASFAASMGEIRDIAESYGVGLVLEAINRYENNYLATAEETAGFIEKYDLDPVGILLDTFHMNIEESDMAAAVRTAGKRLGHFHLADNTRTAPGTGSMDFSKIIGYLREANYGGWLSLECGIRGDEDGEAKAAFDFINNIVKA